MAIYGAQRGGHGWLKLNKVNARSLQVGTKLTRLTRVPLAISADTVVDLYRRRMQAQETFRDHKSHRFGFSLEDVRVSSPQRLRVLLFIAAIAHRIGLSVGKAVEDAGLAPAFQANTVRSSRTLSWFFLGIRFIHRALLMPSDHRLIPLRSIRLLS